MTSRTRSVGHSVVFAFGIFMPLIGLLTLFENLVFTFQMPMADFGNLIPLVSCAAIPLGLVAIVVAWRSTPKRPLVATLALITFGWFLAAGGGFRLAEASWQFLCSTGDKNGCDALDYVHRFRE